MIAPAHAMPPTPEQVGHQRLDPRVQTLWRLSGALSWAPLLLLAVIAAFLLAPYGWLVVLIAVAAAVVSIVVVPPVRYRRWSYVLGDDEFEIRRGAVWTSVTVIPYSRLQFVDTKQGPLDRWFGLATLVVHTAAPGTSGTLPGLAEATANDLRTRLSEAYRRGDEPSV